MDSSYDEEKSHERNLPCMSKKIVGAEETLNRNAAAPADSDWAN